LIVSHEAVLVFVNCAECLSIYHLKLLIQLATRHRYKFRPNSACCGYSSFCFTFVRRVPFGWLETCFRVPSLITARTRARQPVDGGIRLDNSSCHSAQLPRKKIAWRYT